DHTLSIVARDAAGLATTKSISIQLDTAIPLVLTVIAPVAGATDVGSTFHPRIDFSRPIQVDSLSAANFYATDAGGRLCRPTSSLPVTARSPGYSLVTPCPAVQ